MDEFWVAIHIFLDGYMTKCVNKREIGAMGGHVTASYDNNGYHVTASCDNNGSHVIASCDNGSHVRASCDNTGSSCNCIM